MDSQDSKYLPAVKYAALSAPSNLNGAGTQFSQNWTQVLTLLSTVQSQFEMALLADSYCSHKATDCSIVWLCGDIYPSVICVSANSRPAVFGIEFKLPKKGFQTDQ